MTAIEQIQERVLEHFGPDFKIREVVAVGQTPYNCVGDVPYT